MLAAEYNTAVAVFALLVFAVPLALVGGALAGLVLRGEV